MIRYRPRGHYDAILFGFAEQHLPKDRRYSRRVKNFAASAHQVSRRWRDIEYIFGCSPSRSCRHGYAARKAWNGSFIAENLAMPIFIVVIMILAYGAVVLSSYPV